MSTDASNKFRRPFIVAPLVLSPLAVGLTVIAINLLDRPGLVAGSETELLGVLVSAAAAIATVYALVYVAGQMHATEDELRLMREERADEMKDREQAEAAEVSGYINRKNVTVNGVTEEQGWGTTADLEWEVTVTHHGARFVTDVNLVGLGKNGDSSNLHTSVLLANDSWCQPWRAQVDVSNDPYSTKTFALGYFDPTFVILFRDSHGRSWGKVIGGGLIKTQRVEHPHQLFDIAKEVVDTLDTATPANV